MFYDYLEKETLPPEDSLLPSSQSKDSESTVATNDTDTNTSLPVTDIIASENSDSQTAVSTQLIMADVTENSTDA